MSCSPKTITLEHGKSYKLTPVVKPFTSKDKLVFSSKNGKIATVGKDGTVKANAKAAGKSVKITVKSGKKSVTVTVQVK